MKCKHCGATLEENALFCRACGTEVDAEPQQDTEVDAQPQQDTEPAAICNNCGAELDEGAQFCRKCGTPITQNPQQAIHAAAICHSCGAELDEGAQFCRACGAQVTPQPEHAPKKPILRRMHLRLPKLNRRLLAVIGICVLLLAVLIAVIVSIASCSRTSGFSSTDELQQAVIAALEKGDGDRLRALAKTAEPLLGQHPEVYGKGNTPKAVMQNYYRTLAESLKTRITEQYGKGFRLEFPSDTKILTGAEIYETNRALDVDAPQYAVISGTLFVENHSVGTLSMTAAEIDGEWKLLVVYIY